MTTSFLEPRYDSGGFAALPRRLADLLSRRQYDAVILFLVDGFGWRFFEKFQNAPFLRQIAREGTVDKLISQFPSTTAVHLTTLHTGLPVGEHGILEWQYYEPSLDAIISPLLFSFAGSQERDTLKLAGVKPRSLYPPHSLYQTLKRQGVATTIFQHREYTPSVYSNAMFKGAGARGYKTLAEALVNLKEALAASAPPSYFVLYYDRIDSLSHEYGPESPQTTAEILTFLLTVENVFWKALSGSRKKVLFILTADHGEVEVNPRTTIYLNRDPRFKGIEAFLRTDRQGRPLAPGGMCRDFFLYAREGMVEEAQAFLSARLEGRAEVRKVADLTAAGYFGAAVSPALRLRAGDLVILPYGGEAVWWYEKDLFEQRYYGHHGGLTKEEMEIPQVTWEM